ncbi:MAG TPA: NTP transferase domain-containing protein [Gemmatimonadales bacterium]|nr:NTP transferase domain-containing protein [Gemmatimonadales bacterium]
MHGLILAGGEGSRLAAGGVAVPKPLVEVAGRPQIVRLLETLAALGCQSLTCAVRADVPAVRRALDATRFEPPLRVVACRTPSSLHTLVEGLRAVPPGPVFCSMVDTVMRPEDWRTVYRATERYLEEGADIVLAVTPYVDDESPVYVRRAADGAVRALGDEPLPPACVTGGVYGLGAGSRAAAADAVRRGVHKMRRFLQELVAGKRRVVAVEVARIIDIDRPADLETANAWLAAREA